MRGWGGGGGCVQILAMANEHGLVKGKGFSVPVTHPHPKIHKSYLVVPVLSGSVNHHFLFSL